MLDILFLNGKKNNYILLQTKPVFSIMKKKLQMMTLGGLSTQHMTGAHLNSIQKIADANFQFLADCCDNKIRIKSFQSNTPDMIYNYIFFKQSADRQFLTLRKSMTGNPQVSYYAITFLNIQNYQSLHQQVAVNALIQVEINAGIVNYPSNSGNLTIVVFTISYSSLFLPSCW